MFVRQYFSTQYRCPDCGGADAYRSRRRNFLEKFICPLFLLRPARCANCFCRTCVSLLVRLRNPTNKPPVNRAAAA
jgi:hypothetical protein